MDPSLELLHEVVADVPLLVGLLQQLRVAETLEETLGTHGNTTVYNALPNGLACVVWLTFLLAEGNHRKYHVADWVAEHQGVLARLLRVPVVPATDFSDDRLSTLLARLADPVAWARTEAAVLGRQLEVYALPEPGPIRLDSTTEYGFHAPQPGGVMQLGHSKDGRPDLAQVKLMAASLGTGQLLSCVVEPGHRADNPLYTPMVDRARRLLGQRGLLYVGDCKMASLETRAHLVAGGDLYLTTLPKRTGRADELTPWVETLLRGAVPLATITQTSPVSAVPCVLGRGGELRRVLTAEDGTGTAVTWEERVFVFHSATHAAQQSDRLWKTVRATAAQVQALTPPPRKGVKQYRTVEELQTAIDTLLTKAKVAGLLTVTLDTVPWRAGQERAVVTAVTLNTDAVAHRCARMGWRAFVTNAAAPRLTSTQMVTEYRGAWTLERDFHQLKDRPLGIHPLWVRTDVQLTGLMHLLTLAARVLFYLEQRGRDGLRRERRGLTGLHQYRDKAPVTAPTAQKLLAALAERPMVLTYFNLAGHTGWHLSPCPPWVDDVIRLLGLPADTYTRLLNSS
jgi:transposase